MGKRVKIVDLCRVALGLVFVFSGFVKTIDPWGTALKMSEYMNVYGLGGLSGYRIGLAIWFCAAELMMGLMLVWKVKTRLVSVFAVVVMTFFTVLTLLSATVMPVEDCGCFGDALKMSPWASFAKNVVLWALALAVWLNARRTMTFFPVTVREMVYTVVFAAMAGGLGVWCWRHLPLMDLLPYKVGTDLRGALYGENGDSEGEDVRMVYRDLRDGSLREFAVSDTTWWDATRWEFVEQVEEKRPGAGMALREFAVFNAAGDATGEVVGHRGRVYMLCAMKLDMVGARCEARFEKVTKRAYEEGAKVVLLTATPVEAGRVFGAAGATVEVYNVDATTMITMLRAQVGMVVLDDGVVVEKRNCRDIR